MPDITNLIDIHATPEVVFDTVSTAEGIGKWWSTEVSVNDMKQDEIIVRFGAKWKLTLLKLNEVQNKSVTFQITQHDSTEWVDTELHFNLEPDEDWTTLKFDQRGWQNKTDFFRFCSAKWVVFLLSIKSSAETGVGTPYPNETKIGRHD